MGSSTEKAQQDTWWAPQSLKSGEGLRWQIGPLDLTLFRAEAEWHLAYERDEEESPESNGWTRSATSEMPESATVIERFAAGEKAEELHLQPMVADRSLVARPRTPLFVLSGERTKVYVSAPLWIDIRVGSPARSIRELAMKRLSDTWFGPSTREGEVAYALKTHARVRLDEVPVRSYRAITPVVLENHGSDALLVDRMNLPIPYLSLYQRADGHFWTQAVTLTQSGEGLAEVDIQGGPPRESQGAKRVAEARIQSESNLLVRAFSSLIRTLGDET